MLEDWEWPRCENCGVLTTSTNFFHPIMRQSLMANIRVELLTGQDGNWDESIIRDLFLPVLKLF